MQRNQIIWVYILMETDNGSYSFFPLYVPAAFFLLLLFISSHSPHFCLWTIHMYFFEETLQCHWCYSFPYWNHEQGLFLL